MNLLRLLIMTPTLTVVANDVQERAATPVLSTTIKTITVSTVLKTASTLVPLTINTAVASKGTQVIIPNSLTVTFNQVPAYFYMETMIPSIAVSTSYKVQTTRSVVTISPGQTSKTSSATASPTTLSASVCGVEGLVNDTAMGIVYDGVNYFSRGYLTADDLYECWSYCAKLPDGLTEEAGCKSVIFDSTQSTYNCQLYTGKTISSGGSIVTPKSGTGIFFSDVYNSAGSACVQSKGAKYDFATMAFPTTGYYATTCGASPTAFATKTAVADCHVQGVPSSYMANHVWGTYIAKDEFSCQTACSSFQSQSRACYSYSWVSSTKNCTMYTVDIDDTASTSSGISLSNVWPADGTPFCISPKC